MKEAIDILGLIVPCQTSGGVSGCLGQRSYSAGGVAGAFTDDQHPPEHASLLTIAGNNAESLTVVTPTLAACGDLTQHWGTMGEDVGR